MLLLSLVNNPLGPHLHLNKPNNLLLHQHSSQILLRRQHHKQQPILLRLHLLVARQASTITTAVVWQILQQALHSVHQANIGTDHQTRVRHPLLVEHLVVSVLQTNGGMEILANQIQVQTAMVAIRHLHGTLLKTHVPQDLDPIMQVLPANHALPANYGTGRNAQLVNHADPVSIGILANKNV